MAEKSGSNDNENEEKSEEPSTRRLEKAKEEGQVPFSKELVTLSLIIASSFCILLVIPWSVKSFVSRLIPYIDRPDSFEMTEHMFFNIFKDSATTCILFLVPTFVVILLFLLSSGLSQKWGAIHLSSIKPKFENLSIRKGFKKIFSKQNLVENAKNVIKIVLMILALYWALKNETKDFYRWQWFTPTLFFEKLQKLNFLTYLTLVIAFALLGGIDFIYQRFQYYKRLRMSKYDLKQEYKETEGNPEIKSKQKSLLRARTQQKMMESIPKATVILANPTHYAIALIWDEHKMNAPIVIAKGQDYLAQRIKEVAKHNNVPIIENPSLTRALYEAVDLNEEIPPKFYKAVAEVIRIVMKLKNKYF